jgi:hypothetical protein
MASDRSRRDFLTTLAATAAASSVGALAAPLTAGAAPAAPAAPSPPFDDGWAERVRAAKHRMVFDAPEPNEGTALTQAWIHRRGFETMGAAARDIIAVVVFRHAAASLALDDALWAKYKLGALRKIDDPDTKQPAERNPWARTPAGKSNADLDAILGPGVDATVEGVIKAGGVVLVCNLALGRVAQGIAKQNELPVAQVHEELRAGVVPGVLVQPSGIYAVARAQEAGCAFVRST